MITNKQKSTHAFWNDELKSMYRKSRIELKNRPGHDLLKTALEYDGLTYATLQESKVGILRKWGEEWLAFPYETGIQLYRRSGAEKVILHIKGSKPDNSFFCPFQQTDEKLIIAKSPREAMLVYQLLNGKVSVIGFNSGEKTDITDEQEQYLRGALEGINSIYILFDTDNDNSLSISKQLALNIHNMTKKETFFANITDISNGEYKDITDAVRAGKDKKYLDEALEKAQNIKSIKNITHSNLAEEKGPEKIPDTVYENLPKKFGGIFEFVDRSKNRDMLLMASLPVIAAQLDNVHLKYGYEKISPDIYSLVVASAASGKGFANQAKQLALHLSENIDEENYTRINNKLNDKSERIGSLPDQQLRSLFIPANSSNRAIYDLLQTNNGKGLIFETEIDTLLTALGQEWGNFSDLMRKAYHHETCSLSRKGELLRINNPRLSIFMSGTHDQFKEMFRNTENGLYSRFLLYTFKSRPKWISQRPTESMNQLHLHIDQLSKWLFELNKCLKERVHPLEIKVAEHNWDKQDMFFDRKVEECIEFGMPEDYIANVTRNGLVLQKIAMIFTLLRAYGSFGDDLSSRDSITLEDTDFENALNIVDTLLDHSCYLYGILKNGKGDIIKDLRMKAFHEALPDIFEKKDALTIGSDLGLSSASVSRYLKRFLKNGVMSSLKHGEYSKISSN